MDVGGVHVEVDNKLLGQGLRSKVVRPDASTPNTGLRTLTLSQFSGVGNSVLGCGRAAPGHAGDT